MTIETKKQETIDQFEKIIKDEKTIDGLLTTISDKDLATMRFGEFGIVGIVGGIKIVKTFQDGIVYKTEHVQESSSKEIEYQISKPGYDSILISSYELKDDSIKKFLGIHESIDF